MRENKDTNNKKKKSLTLAQKKELCEKRRDQKLSGVQLAAQYGISTSTVSDILKRSEHWLSIDTTLPNANNFREKSSVYPQLEEKRSPGLEFRRNEVKTAFWTGFWRNEVSGPSLEWNMRFLAFSRSGIRRFRPSLEYDGFRPFLEVSRHRQTLDQLKQSNKPVKPLYGILRIYL
ncbi:hypothetical protein C1646_816310 [Rhizophagus diaphanus]|nr:hypothetical protein C1646_816310 [Rhizophagus diaphanus] [Rhizophagus sp. MUCL 43196]